ncbi:hypothetical protein WJX73_009836 [Symbiochloris irregularis]|uniref:Universal stress protein n=1 Tax=Symbiochloris irregularis TaxID=706552 RepID=A0AAW1PZ67_9CHLO
MHAMQPRYKFVIGLSANCKVERRLVDTVLERYGCHVEILFLHVVVLPVGYLVLLDGQIETVKRAFEKHIAPTLQEHDIPHQVQFRPASNSMWLRQPPSVLISHALCSEASAWVADAVVVGGSGRQNRVRAALVKACNANSRRR